MSKTLKLDNIERISKHYGSPTIKPETVEEKLVLKITSDIEDKIVEWSKINHNWKRTTRMTSEKHLAFKTESLVFLESLLPSVKKFPMTFREQTEYDCITGKIAKIEDSMIPTILEIEKDE